MSSYFPLACPKVSHTFGTVLFTSSIFSFLDMSSHKLSTGGFKNSISRLSIMHWTRLLNQAQPSGADGHQRQFSGHPGLTPACSKFFLTVIRGMVKSSMLKT